MRAWPAGATPQVDRVPQLGDRWRQMLAHHICRALGLIGIVRRIVEEVHDAGIQRFGDWKTLVRKDSRRRRVVPAREQARLLQPSDESVGLRHSDLEPPAMETLPELDARGEHARIDFIQPQTLAGVNPAVKEYRKTFSATESVLFFTAV